jgi:hypothetical protein
VLGGASKWGSPAATACSTRASLIVQTTSEQRKLFHGAFFSHLTVDFEFAAQLRGRTRPFLFGLSPFHPRRRSFDEVETLG